MLARIVSDLGEATEMEQEPRFEGRTMEKDLMLAPGLKKIKSAEETKEANAPETAE